MTSKRSTNSHDYHLTLIDAWMKRPVSGFIRTEWAIVCVVLALLVSILLKFANIWIKSDGVANVANIISATPPILIVLLLVVYMIMRPFINRRIIREMENLNKEAQRSQQSSAGDAAHRAEPEK